MGASYLERSARTPRVPADLAAIPLAPVLNTTKTSSKSSKVDPAVDPAANAALRDIAGLRRRRVERARQLMGG